jgi:calcineurin-like phosphoesterase family protein
MDQPTFAHFRRVSNPRPPSKGTPARIHHTPQGNQKFQPLPHPTGVPPYHVALETLVAPGVMQTMQSFNQMVFHVAGDTGGINDARPQQVVAEHMEAQFDAPNPQDRPCFFYHLGDVVYFNGAASEYYAQFYDPYMHYPAPIVAIPGNHDGDPDLTLNPVPASLTAFVENFCAATSHLSAEAQDASRDAMTQPNCYWTLETPLAAFIGMYTNVPNGGAVDDVQKSWLVSELKNADAAKALIVSMHHPIYSLDVHHSGSAYMSSLLDGAIQSSGRTPDIVFAGHVHNYQRFTRRLDGWQIPYIVAGSGGYHSFHYLGKQADGSAIQPGYQPPGEPEITLENFCQGCHGFLRMTLTPSMLKGEYFSVPGAQEPPTNPAALVDQFTLDLKAHTVSSSKPAPPPAPPRPKPVPGPRPHRHPGNSPGGRGRR